MDPDPGKEIEVDPDPERRLKWIRIRLNAVDPGGSGSETLFLYLGLLPRTQNALSLALTGTLRTLMYGTETSWLYLEHSLKDFQTENTL